MEKFYLFLGSLGFFVNLLGVLVWYQLGYMYGWQVLSNQGVPLEKQVSFFQWNILHIPPMLHLGTLLTGYWEPIEPKKLYAYWEGCLPDNFIYCNFGIGIIPVLFVIAFLGYLIIKRLHWNKSGLPYNQNLKMS